MKSESATRSTASTKEQPKAVATDELGEALGAPQARNTKMSHQTMVSQDQRAGQT